LSGKYEESPSRLDGQARYLSLRGVLMLEIGEERAHVGAAFPDLPVNALLTRAGEDQVRPITAAALALWVGALVTGVEAPAVRAVRNHSSSSAVGKAARTPGLLDTIAPQAQAR
jgi:hypothetical protein